jgi:5-methylcytosine-specific restriction protein A
MAYYIDHFDDETWDEAGRVGKFSVSGHPETLVNRGEIGKGDVLLCYRLKKGEFIGALEVTGDPYEVGEDGPRIWRRELYPLRIPVRLVARVALDDGVKREAVIEISDRPKSWTNGGVIRNSGNSITDSEGDWILEQLKAKEQLAADAVDHDPLREDLATILGGIAQARTETFADHPLANFIRNRWAYDLKRSAWPEMYRTKGSAGSGNWAEVVWAAIFNRLVTEKATAGYYVTYLVEPSGERLILTLMRGTTEIIQEYGLKKGLEVLKAEAAFDLELLVKEDLSGLITGPVSTGGSDDLAQGYDAGSIVAVEYQREALPEVDVLRSDLSRFLALYRSLYDARLGLDSQESQGASTGPVTSGTAKARRERRRTRVHESAERNQALSRDAKKIHGTRCQVKACAKDLGEIYGPLAEGIIEAHHVVPFAQLDDDVELDPKRDFRVVCPDCHRAIHSRRPEPYTLEEISEALEARSKDQEDHA